MITNMFKSKEPKQHNLICPVCKSTTTIQATHQIQWRLDCLVCCQIENVKVVITEWRRDEVGQDFHAIRTKMYINLPDKTALYVWTWDFNNNKTTLEVVDRDMSTPIVHTFDEIMDINLTNYINKTKMCLIFG